jgi:hypothetical protein
MLTQWVGAPLLAGNQKRALLGTYLTCSHDSLKQRTKREAHLSGLESAAKVLQLLQSLAGFFMSCVMSESRRSR